MVRVAVCSPTRLQASCLGLVRRTPASRLLKLVIVGVRLAAFGLFHTARQRASVGWEFSPRQWSDQPLGLKIETLNTYL